MRFFKHGHVDVDQEFVERAARAIVSELQETRRTMLRDAMYRSPAEQDAIMARVRELLRDAR